MSLKDEMVKLARTAGGSFKTRSDRESIAGRFADHLKNDLNIQIKLVDQIKIAHVEKFVEHRLNEGISKRTMQNEMASVRSVLREAGRDQILTQERLTNKSLGIDGACREGTKTALPEERYRNLYVRLKSEMSALHVLLALAGNWVYARKSRHNHLNRCKHGIGN